MLLLVLPSGAFKAIVPALIILALLLVVLGPRLTRWLATATHYHASETVTPLVWLATAGAGTYGGYFGAAQGVLLLGAFGPLLTESLQRQNALKNVLVGLVNLVAAIVFTLTIHVDWAAAALIAAGAIAGGVLGARFGRRLPPTVLRAAVVIVGAAAVIRLVFEG